MTPTAQGLSQFYDRILGLYPAGFREEYAEEMRAVFRLQIEDAEPGFWTAFRITWDELRPLPGLLLAAHWRERKISPMKTGLERWFVQPEGSWKELILAGLPFLLAGFLPGLFSSIPAVNNLPPQIGITILVVLTLILAAIGLIGLIVKLPRWTLAYAGILLTLLTFGALVIGARLNDNFDLLQFPPGWSPSQAIALVMAVFLAGLFILTGMVIWLSGKLKLTAEFHHRVKTDPSLLSWMLYGGAFLFMVGTYEDVSRGGLFLMLSALAMLLGAWGYLRAAMLRAQLFSMVTGSTVATGLGLAANLLLVNYNTPPEVVAGLEIERVVIYVLLTWLASLSMILLPVVLFRGKTQPAAA